MHPRPLFLSIFGLIGSASPGSSQDSVNTRILTYPIHGSTSEELRNAVIEASRNLGQGVHGAASASFKFVPELDYRRIEQGCILSDVRVRLDATITLPTWVSSRGADEATAAAWRRFSRYVQAHEARHKAIAGDFRRMMVRELEAIGVMEDCPTLGQAAVAVVAEVEEMHNEAQVAFDVEERGRSSLLGR